MIRVDSTSEVNTMRLMMVKIERALYRKELKELRE